ncbi:uncharacterized protein [Argopecten irradians]|uniref:uncharacterized protein n=1 Tax=Argopecten irradians TaxID=31199 RepID=UPI00371A17F4
MAAGGEQLYEISKLNFEHIKYGEPCSLTESVILQMSKDVRFQREQKDISQLLAQCLDVCHGTEEMVKNRRKVLTIRDYIQNYDNESLHWMSGGSVGDGFRFKTSDHDAMHTMKYIVAVYEEQTHLIPVEDQGKQVVYVREMDCRPGYVNLEIPRISHGSGFTSVFLNAIVPLNDSMYLSSDIYRQTKVDAFQRVLNVGHVSHGPCSTVYSKHFGRSVDLTDAFHCISWPKAATEWIHRPRFYGWPTESMIEKIVRGGCHLVPVGDKCSPDTLLQWRISFASAEQMLVHSLTHPQFRMYGLLKHLLVQIEDLLEYIIGDSDIVCSYFIKTLILHAVETTPYLLCSENNTYLCFRFCLSILIEWVRSGYCPNYFIPTNNMFLRKVHGEARQKLLHLLKDMYNLNWMCLCVESPREMYIGKMLQQSQCSISTQRAEYMRDVDLFHECLFSLHGQTNNKGFLSSMNRLLVSQTDADDFIAYFAMATALTRIAGELLLEYNTTRSNKQKYIVMKKCRNLLRPSALMCDSPGMMVLATFYYLTGNYRMALQMCEQTMSSCKIYIGKSIQATNGAVESLEDTSNTRKYVSMTQHRNCKQGYTFYHRFKDVFYSCLVFTKNNNAFCLPQLHQEVTRYAYGVYIPPLPYAAFLSFLCYHELGDFRRRDNELLNLQIANYDPFQGGHNYWVVHTLLGICYQIVGDKSSAIAAFTESLLVMPEFNPAIERIEDLRNTPDPVD